MRRKGRHVPEEGGAEHDVGDVGVALDGVGLVGTMPARVMYIVRNQCWQSELLNRWVESIFVSMGNIFPWFVMILYSM